MMKHLESIQQLGVALLQTTSIEDFRTQLLKHLECIFNADDSLFLDWTSMSAKERRFTSDDILVYHQESPPLKRYFEICHEDPIYRWASSSQCLKDECVTRYSDLFDFKTFKKSRFYSELVKPLNYRYVLSLAFIEQGELIGNVSLMRFTGKRNFTQSELTLARAITPMINAAYQNVLLKKELSLGSDVFDVVESQSKERAYLLLSPTLKTLYCSEKAQSLKNWQLAQNSLPFIEWLMQSELLKEYLALYTSKQAAIYRKMPLEITDTIKVTTSQNVAVTLRKFKSKTPHSYLLVVFEEPTNGDGIPSHITALNLTMRELQIAQLACEDKNSHQIGKQLCISHWSVKNHLKNVYKKTGVNSRVQLAKVLNYKSLNLKSLN